MPSFAESFFGSPEQTQALGALGVGLMSGNPAAGFNSALEMTSPDAQNKRLLARAQLQDVLQQMELRKQQAAQLERKNSLISGWLSGQGAPDASTGASGGAVPSVPGSAAPGAVPSAPRSSPFGGVPRDAISADLAFNDGKNIPGWMFKRGVPSMKVSNGYAFDENTVQPGFLPQFNVSQDGKATISLVDPKTGLPTVMLPKGALEAQAAQTIAGKLPEAIIGSAGKLNLRPMPDGTQKPVSELSENQSLQNLVSQFFPGAALRPQLPAGAPMLPSAAPGPNSANPANPMASQPADADRSFIYQGEWKAAQDRLAAAKGPVETQRALTDMKSLQSEMTRLGIKPGATSAATPAVAAPAAPATAVAPVGADGAPQYGMTIAQQNAAAADKERAVEGAKADVARATGNKADSKRYGQMRAGLDRAMELLQAGPTESGMGSAFDSAAGFFGQSTKGADLASQLSTLSGWLTANTPRMEGPQSNADVQQYAIMAGTVGDKTKPVSQRLKAAEEVRRLQDKYAALNGYGGASQAPSGASPTEPAPKQTLEALPPNAPKGQRVRDTATGKILKFDGSAWVEEK